MAEEIIFRTSVDTGDMDSSLNKTQDELKQTDEQVKKTGRDFQKELDAIKEKVESGTLTQRQLTKAVREYQSIALQAGETSPVGQQAIAEAGQLSDRLGDLKNSVNVLAHDGANMQAALQLGQTVAAGYGAFQGVLALTGVQSEALEESLVKLQAIQVTLTSVEQIRAALEKESFLMMKAKVLWTNLQAAASNKLTIAEIAKNGVMAITTGVTAAATTAMAALNAVMMLNPIFLLIAAFAAGAAALALFGGSADHAAEDNEKLNETMERQNELLELSNQKLIRNADNRIKILQAEGASEEELFKARLNRIDVEEKTRRKDVALTKKHLRDKIEVFNQAVREQDEDTIKAAADEIKALSSKYKKLKALDDQYLVDRKAEILSYNRKQREDEAKEQKQLADEQKKKNEEAAQKAKQYRDEQRRKREEEAQKQLEYERLITDLSIANIQDEGQRKLAAMAVNHQREREELVKKYGQDTRLLSMLEQKQKSELDALQAEQAKADKEKADAERLKQLEADRRSQKAELEAELIMFRDDFEARMELTAELAKLERDQALLNTELTEGEKFKIQQEYEQKLADIDKQREEEAKRVDAAIVASKQMLVSSISTILGSLESSAKKNSGLQKTLAIAQIAYDTAVGFVQGLRLAQKAASELPPGSGPIARGIVFATFAAQQIAAVKKAFDSAKGILGGGGGSVQAPTVGGGGANAPQGNQPEETGGTQTGSTQTGTGFIPVLVVDSFNKVNSKDQQAATISTTG